MKALGTDLGSSRAGAGLRRFRPRTLSALVALAFSKYSHAQWKPNVETYVKPGDDRSYVGVDGVVPFWQDGRSLAAGDFKFKQGSHDSQEFNVGALFRRYLGDKEDWAYGLYGAWDRRRAPTTGTEFDELTLGAELRSAVWDFRGNYYAPQTKKQLVGLGTSSFSGFGVFRNGVFEEAMRGYDLEVGGRLPIDILGGELRAYVAGYSFKGDDVAPKTSGTRVRLDYSPRQDWTIGLSAQRDPLFGGAMFLEVRYSFGKPASTAPKTLQDRMIDPWVRDIDVAISPVIESTNPAFRQVVQSTGVVNVDSSKPAGGDGSAEHPYNSIVACVKCAIPSYNIVRLWQGTSTTTPYTSVVLLPNQTLWGQGVDIFTNAASPGLRPVISSAGDAVTLTSGGSNFSVAGVTARSTGGNGVMGSNVAGNITVRDSAIQASSGGIILTNGTGAGSLSSNISITNNQISATGGAGVFISFKAGSGTWTQAVTISGNTINSSADGIDVWHYAGPGSSTQTVMISGNTIGATGGHGVYLYNRAYGGGQATQAAMLSGNTISAGAGYQGVKVENNGAVGTSTQTAAISNNTISTSGSPGVFLGNYVNGGAANQNATLTGNTITASATSGTVRGVYARNHGDSGGMATQSLVMTGNTVTATGTGTVQGLYALNHGYNGGTGTQSLTITGNTFAATASSGYAYGVKFRNDGSAGTATQSVMLSGNTIAATLTGANGFSYGVFAQNRAYFAGGSASQSLTLSGNTIQASGRYARGVQIANTGYSGSGGTDTASQMVTLTSNTIAATATNGHAYGVYGYNRGASYNGSSTGNASQTWVLSNNSITASGTNGAGGLQIRNRGMGYSGSTGIGTQSVVLSGNTMAATSSNGPVAGFYVYNRAGAAGGGVGTANQMLTVTGNSLSAVGSGIYVGAIGLRLRSGQYNGGVSTQTSMVTGNTITATAPGTPPFGSVGVLVQGNAPAQTTTLSGNSIMGSSKYGAKVVNNGAGSCTGSGDPSCP